LRHQVRPIEVEMEGADPVLLDGVHDREAERDAPPRRRDLALGRRQRPQVGAAERRLLRAPAAATGDAADLDLVVGGRPSARPTRSWPRPWARADLKLGDQVAFPADAVPKYLRGVTGEIVAIRQRWGDRPIHYRSRPYLTSRHRQARSRSARGAHLNSYHSSSSLSPSILRARKTSSRTRSAAIGRPVMSRRAAGGYGRGHIPGGGARCPMRRRVTRGPGATCGSQAIAPRR
jgi:hypothetical protein